MYPDTAECSDARLTGLLHLPERKCTTPVGSTCAYTGLIVPFIRFSQVKLLLHNTIACI